MKKIIVGLTGATGIIYGIKLLQTLHESVDVESHLIISDAAKLNVKIETTWKIEEIESMATYVYDNRDLCACLTSGSFTTDGMVVIPCSIKTLSSIENSLDYNLITRAADVTIKERRTLILVVRETPLHIGHLRMMLSVAERGGIILPPVPAFYSIPKSIDDIVNQTVGKILDQFKIEHKLYQRWQGVKNILSTETNLNGPDD